MPLTYLLALTYSLTHSLTYVPTRLLTYLRTYLLTYLPTQPLAVPQRVLGPRRLCVWLLPLRARLLGARLRTVGRPPSRARRCAPVGRPAESACVRAAPRPTTQL